MAGKGDLMATFKFEGVDQLVQQYEKLENETTNIIGKAIYNGAGVVMDSVKQAVDGIQTDDHYGTPEHRTTGPSSIQKAGLQHALGIAKMRNDAGFYNVKIGFDGYNRVKTKTWPQGQPNMMVARAVESGTSWMMKQPFMRKAEQSSKGRCEKVMGETVDKAITQIIGG